MTRLETPAASFVPSAETPVVAASAAVRLRWRLRWGGVLAGGRRLDDVVQVILQLSGSPGTAEVSRKNETPVDDEARPISAISRGL